jgi:uncharacterized protein (TIGR02246 family)
MNRRHFIAATPILAATCGTTNAADDDDSAVRAVVQRYVDARVSEDPKAIQALLTLDADQLVSDGTWRRGRGELVKGMLESSKKNPANPAIAVVSVRMLTPDVAMADGRYTLKAKPGGTDREMWTAITMRRGADGWRIAAIRNMLPAKG